MLAHAFLAQGSFLEAEREFRKMLYIVSDRRSIARARWGMAQALEGMGRPDAAVEQYEAIRGPATAKVVLTNRSDPPDAILREVWQRSNGQPFARIEDVIAPAELQAMSDRYKKVAGFDVETLRTRPSFV